MKNENLDEYLKNAFSIENMAGHDAEGREVKEIGSIIKGKRKFIIYKDSEGAYWYKSLIDIGSGSFAEEEIAIFGRTINKRHRKQSLKE